MKPATFNRLHSLRMANDAAGFAMAELKPRFDRLAGRHENGSAPRAVVVHQLFQTPPDLAARLVALLDLVGMARCAVPGGTPAGTPNCARATGADGASAPSLPLRILEPSAGLGRILDAISACQRFSVSAFETVAVEIAPDCAQELFNQDRPNVRIRQRDFLTCTPAELGLFDCIAMNPPFTMRADIRHILHARQFLKPGGRLAALCFDTPSRHAKLKPLCREWISIPAGTFKHEGTNVPTALLLIQN